MRGLYDNSFEDQFTWLRFLETDFRVLPRIVKILHGMKEPLVVSVFAEMQ